MTTAAMLANAIAPNARRETSPMVSQALFAPIARLQNQAARINQQPPPTRGNTPNNVRSRAVYAAPKRPSTNPLEKIRKQAGMVARTLATFSKSDLVNALANAGTCSRTNTRAANPCALCETLAHFAF